MYTYKSFQVVTASKQKLHGDLSVRWQKDKDCYHNEHYKW